MATARKEIVIPNKVQTFHCISRCVRRSYLCGIDNILKKSFEHRKDWVRDRIKFLSQVFLIDIGTYAVMSNHLHVVLRTRPDRALALTQEEILQRWGLIYSAELDEENDASLTV